MTDRLGPLCAFAVEWIGSIMSQDLERYHRQMLLPGFGEEGQRKLLNAKVLVVGCGALGTVIANMLARAGVGHLVIVDRDFIEITNLQRQVLFDENDVKEAIPKAEAARRKIAQINSQVKVDAIVDDVNHTNIERLATQLPGVGKVGLIMDGVDNFETRYLANDVAVKHGIPYIYGGAVGTVGASYAILPHTPGGDTPWEQAGKATPCLRCIFEQAPPPGVNPTCDTAGVIGPAVSIVANYQVAEALKVLTGNMDAVSPTMLNIDLWSNVFKQFKVTANKFMLRADITDNGELYELTLFNDGRAIVKGTKHANVAKSIYAKYVGA